MIHFTSLLSFEIIFFTVFVNNYAKWNEIEKCPFSEEEWNIRAKIFSCEYGKITEYHCMLDFNGNSIEACIPVKDFKEGCPWIYTTSDGKTFLGSKGTQCIRNRYCPDPDIGFRTNQLFKYPACLVGESQRINFTLQDYLTSSLDNKNESKDSLDEDSGRWKVPVALSVAGLGCFLLIIAMTVYIKRRRASESDFEAGAEESIALLSDVPQVFLIKPLDVAPGGAVTISCIIRGMSDSTTLGWEKDGKILNTKDTNKYEKGKLAKPYLAIKNVSRDDAGAYRCIATNQNGTEKSEVVYLNVVDAVHHFEEECESETMNIEKAKEILMKEGIVILVGDTGSGKTTAFEKIHLSVFDALLSFQKWNTRHTLSDFYKDLERMSDFYKDLERKAPIDRLIICLDDCCGKYNTNPVLLNRMKTTLHELIKLSKTHSEVRKVIVTLRNKEFIFIKSCAKDIKPIIKCAVNVRDIISDNAESNLLKRLPSSFSCNCQKCKRVNLISVKQSVTEEQLRSISNLLGWPLVRRLVTIPYIAQNIKCFFEKPFITLVNGVEDLKETDIAAYCGLVYMMLTGGTLNTNELDQGCLKHVLLLHSALPEHDCDLAFSTRLLTQQLHTVPEYVKYNNEIFTFFHDIMTLAVFCSFYKKYPNDTIRLCDLQIISDLFRPEGYDEFQEDGVISEAKELVREIKESVRNQSIKSRCFRCFKPHADTREHELITMKYNFTLNRENLECLIRRMDDEHKQHLFENHPLMDFKEH